MLLADIPERDIFPLAVTDRDPEYPFGQKDSFGMMPQRPMANIRQYGFRFVKPLVDEQVVFGGAAELSRTVFRVLQRMGHDSNLPRVGGIADDFIPVVLDANLARLNVESNRSMSARAVLISFGCRTFEQVTELADIEVIRQARVIDWVVCGVLELRRFCRSEERRVGKEW